MIIKFKFQILLIFLFTSFVFPQQKHKITIGGKAEYKTDEFMNDEIFDSNGKVCGILIIITDLKDLNFQSVNSIVKIDMDKSGKYFLFLSPDEKEITIFKKEYEPLRLILREHGIEKLESMKIWQIRITEETILPNSEFDFVPLTILSNPVAANIYIDNTEIGETNKELNLYPGKYSLRLSKVGYRDTSETIEIKKNSSNNFEYILIKNSGILKIKVVPEDAHILINKEDYSNQKEIELAPGKYKVEIEKPGFKKISEFVNVKPNNVLVKNYNLAGKVGSLHLIVSPIEANVKLIMNGEVVNSWIGSKIEKGIAVGEYNLEITAPDHTTVKKTLTITENNTTIDEITLISLVKQKTILDKSNMIFVEGGSFKMGSEVGPNDEKPVHIIKLKNFYIDKYEVTVMEYRKFCNSIGRDMPVEPQSGWNDNDPISNVSWEDANKYAEWIGKRLPTEAEWEYAARGGVNSKSYLYSGSNSIENVGWCINNSERRIHAVGLKQPNELGIYDMSGNVSEWCYDWYSSIYYQKSNNQNPVGPQGGIYRVFRGGAWDSYNEKCWITSRNCGDPESLDNSGIGFRLVYDKD